MDLSIIVTSYKRFDSCRALVGSIRREFSNITYEIVFVTSDPESSEKIQWLRGQRDVVLISNGDRSEGKKRNRSLYFYENQGLSRALGTWISIINDDCEFLPGTADSFSRQSMEADVLIMPSHLDRIEDGLRAPTLGYVRREEIKTPIYLTDFAIFRKSVLTAIGPADESFDWYGRGPDMGVRIALEGIYSVEVLDEGGLAHHILEEGRNPPHPGNDIEHLYRKWDGYNKSQTSTAEIVWSERPRYRNSSQAWRQVVWPFFQRIKKALRLS